MNNNNPFGEVVMSVVVLVAIAFIGHEMFRSPTVQEISETKARCEMNGQDVYVGRTEVRCQSRPDKIQDCIDSYVDAIDEKYNNPDHVSNLSEDGYVSVVKTCEETFGSK